MMFRVLIADDEALSRARLRELIREEANLHLIAECANGKEAVQAIGETSPDLVFLDVRMPELDGFGVVEALKAGTVPAIIFATAYDEFAVRAFEVHAVDYLLKPFDRERFQMALRRAYMWLQRQASARQEQLLAGVVATLRMGRKPLDRIPVRSEGRISLVKTEEIDWISAADNYAELHVGKQSYLVRMTIKDLADQLREDEFIQVSRSHLVKLDRIREVSRKDHGDFVIILRDGTAVAGGRTYRDNLARLL
jgi:two-component system, LytTR family, response regulator